MVTFLVSFLAVLRIRICTNTVSIVRLLHADLLRQLPLAGFRSQQSECREQCDSERLPLQISGLAHFNRLLASSFCRQLHLAPPS